MSPFSFAGVNREVSRRIRIPASVVSSPSSPVQKSKRTNYARRGGERTRRVVARRRRGGGRGGGGGGGSGQQRRDPRRLLATVVRTSSIVASVPVHDVSSVPPVTASSSASRQVRRGGRKCSRDPVGLTQDDDHVVAFGSLGFETESKENTEKKVAPEGARVSECVVCIIECIVLIDSTWFHQSDGGGCLRRLRKARP